MAERNPSSSETTRAIKNRRSEHRTTDELGVDASRNTAAPRHYFSSYEVEPPAAQLTRPMEEVNWLHTLPQHIPLMKKKRKVGDRTESRVTLWNPSEKRKLSGNAAPFESNVESYLLRHPVSLLE